jgi:nucleoside-diphosphate-sugar epimerase
MKVMLTGASGMLGREVLRELKARKHKVIEFDRSNDFDILNMRQVESEMKKVDACIHLAGIVENDNPNLWQVNVEGTRNIARAAEKTRLYKLLFVSSTAVYGFTKGVVNEETSVSPENNYEKSKAEGEKIVLGIKGKTIKTIVRSAMILGTNDYWRRMFRLLKKQYPLPCRGDNTFQIVYAKELARAIVLVLEKGSNGNIYLAAGKEKKTLNEFCEIAQEALGMKRGVTHIATWLGLLVGRIVGTKLLTMENVRHISKERNYDTGKIQKLGYKQKISLKDAISETINEIGKQKDSE